MCLWIHILHLLFLFSSVDYQLQSLKCTLKLCSASMTTKHLAFEMYTQGSIVGRKRLTKHPEDKYTHTTKEQSKLNWNFWGRKISVAMVQPDLWCGDKTFSWWKQCWRHPVQQQTVDQTHPPTHTTTSTTTPPHLHHDPLLRPQQVSWLPLQVFPCLTRKHGLPFLFRLEFTIMKQRTRFTLRKGFWVSERHVLSSTLTHIAVYPDKSERFCKVPTIKPPSWLYCTWYNFIRCIKLRCIKTSKKTWDLGERCG